jgi:Leucine-rich repeat (LRR) protein
LLLLFQVCELEMLESLTLHNNGLPSLRREIGMLTNLVNLSLTGNYLAELPPTVISSTRGTWFSLGLFVV